MELIKRYVYAVTSNLAQNQRDEVSRELSASIEDMARDKSGGKTPTDKHIREVLEELGDPLVVARQYRGTGEYLIGPSLFYQYIWLLKRIFMFALPIYTLVFAIGYDYTAPLQVGGIITSWLDGAFTVALHVFFWVTAIFFVLEKTGVKVDQINSTQEEWSVDSLPQLPRQSQISLVDTISSMFFYAFLIVGGVIVWQLIDQGENVVAAFLSPQLTQVWLPILIFLSVSALTVDAIKLIIGNWSVWLMTLAVAVNVMFVGYIVALVSSQNILNTSLNAQAREIAIWSIGITVVVFIFSYIYESYKIVKQVRAQRAQHK